MKLQSNTHNKRKIINDPVHGFITIPNELIFDLITNSTFAPMKKDIQIALIAHDGKKPEMVAFVLNHKTFLANTDIYATGTTGGHIEKAGFVVVVLVF